MYIGILGRISSAPEIVCSAGLSQSRYKRSVVAGQKTVAVQEIRHSSSHGNEDAHTKPNR